MELQISQSVSDTKESLPEYIQSAQQAIDSSLEWDQRRQMAVHVHSTLAREGIGTNPDQILPSPNQLDDKIDEAIKVALED